MGKIGKLLAVGCLALSGLLVSACTSGGSPAKDNTVAATVNGRNIMLSEVERMLSQQTGGKPEQLNQLQLAAARLQILESLIPARGNVSAGRAGESPSHRCAD